MVTAIWDQVLYAAPGVHDVCSFCQGSGNDVLTLVSSTWPLSRWVHFKRVMNRGIHRVSYGLMIAFIYYMLGFSALNMSAHVLLDFSLTVKAATLIFISGCGWAISSAKEGKSGFVVLDCIDS